MTVLPLKTLAVLEDNISAEETTEHGGGVEQDHEVRMWVNTKACHNYHVMLLCCGLSMRYRHNSECFVDWYKGEKSMFF